MPSRPRARSARSSRPAPPWIPGRVSALTGLALLAILPSTLAPRTASALEIYGTSEVEKRFVVERDGELHLRLDGREWELVTDPNAPGLSPLADGSFHPMAISEVRAAIRAMRGSFDLPGRLLVLPFPRRSTLRSSHERGVVFLSPGVREVPREHVHATVVHELGHLVQHVHAPEGSAAWEEYLDRRHLRSPRFHGSADHRDRPREIFAEDFRFFFGGPLATASGSIENSAIPLPSEMPGLSAFFARILAESAEAPEASVFPNPVRPGAGTLVRARFSTPSTGAAPTTGEVVNVEGRVIRRMSGWVLDGETVEFRWDGRDGENRPVPSGVYFLRWRERARAAARILVLH